MIDIGTFRTAVRQALLDGRNAAGHWEGRLSSSALSTATAVIALRAAAAAGVLADPTRARRLIDAGIAWLARTQNEDGGWGDTPQSMSNISTTALAWGATDDDSPSFAAASAWLAHAARGLDAVSLSRAIAARYGKDRTFSVPILTALAISARLGADGWRHVPQLPFELAACPPRWFRWLRLPVVSYALPALIAIGQARHASRPTRNPATRAARALARARTLRVLRGIQPSSGGYLEATPLTSFVVMSLVQAGAGSGDVAREGLAFLERSAREDGSWPIDTNLATWVTTLSVNALGARALEPEERGAIVEWLLSQQYREEHPYTQAAPGGWAWTDLPGGVPDADDTAGALLALAALAPDDPRAREAAAAGARWLLDLQNRDGGMPTFCRGWGALPFDRSGADLTAHAIRAWVAWRDRLPSLDARIDVALGRARLYLARQQRPDGAWAPLWFGNERAPGDVNLTYGTAKVVNALAALGAGDTARAMAERGAAWLMAAQRPDGGWGGAADAPRATLEETALAVEAIAHMPTAPAARGEAIARGIAWLDHATAGGRDFLAAPIGLYFASLWYSEDLYPLIFTAAAVEAATSDAAPSMSKVRRT